MIAVTINVQQANPSVPVPLAFKKTNLIYDI